MLEVVEFRAAKYGQEVTRILALYGDGAIEMALTRPASGIDAARDALAGKTVSALFPMSRTPEAALAQGAATVGYATGTQWDPIAFVEYCGQAHAGSISEQIAQRVQLIEWQLLFDYSTGDYSTGESTN